MSIFEKYDNFNNMPNDFKSLIIQLLENNYPDEYQFIIKNMDKTNQIKIITSTHSVERFHNIVKEWDTCYCRGEKHIRSMKTNIQKGIKIPPIVHILFKGNEAPVDGRHRLIALSELGFKDVESIPLVNISEQIKLLQVS
jgi:hypothetical protein